jgi:hypothetical protein
MAMNKSITRTQVHSNSLMMAIIIGALFASSTLTAQELRFEEGIARDPDSKKSMYIEQHWIRSNGETPVERLVLYRCTDGTAFARKRVNYQNNLQAPAFEFTDGRKKVSEGLRYAAAGPALWFRGAGVSTEKVAALSNANLVADAGFDEFIRLNWTNLRAGKEIPLNFAVPTRLKAYKFNLKQIGESQFAGKAAVTFELKIAGLLSLIADPIQVTYGKNDKRLLSFKGLSNLRDDQGGFDLNAKIDFLGMPRSASETEWQAASKLALGNCLLKK